MNDLTDIISRVEKYAKENGTTAKSVFRAATGNPRLLKRTEDRIDRLQEDIKRLEKYMNGVE